MKKIFLAALAFFSIAVFAQSSGPLPKDIYGKGTLDRYQSIEDMAAIFIKNGSLSRELTNGQILDLAYEFDGRSLLRTGYTQLMEHVCTRTINGESRKIYSNLSSEPWAYLLPSGGPKVDFTAQINTAIAELKKTSTKETTWSAPIGKTLCNTYLGSTMRKTNADPLIPEMQRYIVPSFAAAEICELANSWFSGTRPSTCHLLIIKTEYLTPAIEYAKSNYAPLMALEREKRAAQQAENDLRYQEFMLKKLEPRPAKVIPENRLLDHIQNGLRLTRM